MEAAIRRHRDSTVLALGIMSLSLVLGSIAAAIRGFDLTIFCLLACFVAVLLGSLAIIVGLRHTQQSHHHRSRKTRTGQALGAAAVTLALLLGTGLVV